MTWINQLRERKAAIYRKFAPHAPQATIQRMAQNWASERHFYVAHLQSVDRC